MGLERKDIGSGMMHEAIKEFALQAKKRGLRVGVGGGVSAEGISEILKHKEIVDKFETRKIVFPLFDDEKTLKNGIMLAMKFEILYLKYKCDFYGKMANEDLSRMKMLEQRYNLGKA